MKKIVIFSVVAVSLVLLSVESVSAQNIETNMGLGATGDAAGFSSTLKSRTPAETIGVIINTLLSLVGVGFLGLMIYGGYIWMIARGNEQEVERAKKSIEQGVTGLIIILAAYAITVFIGQALK
jgi:cytochrome bd-type quinol oxidase subunit 2